MVMVGRGCLLFCVAISVTTMPAVASMTKQMEQRTREEEQVWPVSIDVCPVLREEEEADDGEETEECDSEATHREGWE